MSEGGSAPQSTTTNGPARRELSSCTEVASESLPVPDSPSNRIVIGERAALRSNAKMRRMLSLTAMLRPKRSRSAPVVV
jgi:hypothetical protein